MYDFKSGTKRKKGTSRECKYPSHLWSHGVGYPATYTPFPLRAWNVHVQSNHMSPLSSSKESGDWRHPRSVKWSCLSWWISWRMDESNYLDDVRCRKWGASLFTCGILESVYLQPECRELRATRVRNGTSNRYRIDIESTYNFETSSILQTSSGRYCSLTRKSTCRFSLEPCPRKADQIKAQYLLRFHFRILKYLIKVCQYYDNTRC